VKIVIPGGSGQVGTLLARAFHRDGHDVVVLSRRPAVQPWRVVAWNGSTPGDWQREIDDCDVVVNLAGRSVNCRYTPANRHAILQSRVSSTRVVGQAIANARRPPRVWLQASTATIYAHRDDRPNDEHTGILGGDEPNAPGSWRFSIDVARAWEHAFAEAITNGTRKIAMRSAMTLSPDRGGVFDAFLGLARHGLGGSSGDGRQFVSWVHYEDFIAAVQWLIDRHDMAGIVNIASPNPLPNAGVHANSSPGLRRFVWPAVEQMDARGGRRLDAHRNRAHSQEPARRSGETARKRFQVQVRAVARCRTRSLSRVEAASRQNRGRAARSLGADLVIITFIY
jgi:uncharacterized protein (TIGR01777 family)